jgi:hypothetical protein
VDVLEVEVSFFFQPLEERIWEHQHLELVPQLFIRDMSVFIFNCGGTV